MTWTEEQLWKERIEAVENRMAEIEAQLKKILNN